MSAPQKHNNIIEVKVLSDNGEAISKENPLYVSLDGGEDLGNCSQTPLLANQEFVGQIKEINEYVDIVIAVYSDVASAIDGLRIEYSRDGTNFYWHDHYTIPANSGKVFSAQRVAKYYRIKYTNGATNQTVFSLSSIISKTQSKPSSHRIQDNIIDDDDAELQKAVLTAKTPSGRFVNINANAFGNLQVSLQEQKDAFGRLKSAEPYTIFDNSLTCPEGDTIFRSTLTNGTGAGNYETSRLNARFDMTTSASGDYVVRMTKQRFKYQPGKSYEFLCTGLLTDEPNIRKRIGIIDYDNIGLATITNTPQNGVFFQNINGLYSRHIVKNGVITESASQTDWNMDKCDGTGLSGFVFDPMYCNIYGGQLERLGVGAVVVGFALDSGEFVPCHIFKHASTASFVDVYMRTANLPVAYEITQLGAGSGSMKQICTCITSNGGFNPRGLNRTYYNLAINNFTAGQIKGVVGIRLKEDYFEYTNIIESISALASSSANARRLLCFNPTYTGTPTRTSETNSILEKSETNNIVITNPGIVFASGLIAGKVDLASSDIPNSLRLGKGLNGIRDEIRLVIENFTGNESYYGAINTREIF